MNKAITTLVQDIRPIRKSKLPVSLRKPRDERGYGRAKRRGAARKPFLEEPRIREWQYWALIDNAFPYSAAFSTHHMLIPKRVASREQIKRHEYQELQSILAELESSYDCCLVNFPAKQSIVSHYHIHM
jgi:hypothetical protein